ncbi:hypothetical protein QUA44_11375 [Microcoleus sp. N9_A2]|uniref:hypothetical protein n=1 Tax=unclassified Microcoleus TaxID=2642155 RepID=UPI002FD655F2
MLLYQFHKVALDIPPQPPREFGGAKTSSAHLYKIGITQQQRLLFARGEVVSTQIVLLVFSIAVDELLA